MAFECGLPYVNRGSLVKQRTYSIWPLMVLFAVLLIMIFYFHLSFKT